METYPTPRFQFKLEKPPIRMEFHKRDKSGRLSSVGVGSGYRTRFEDYKDRHFQQSAVSTINAFLSSQSFPISFQSATTPSAEHVLETLRFLLSLVDFPCSSKLDDDLSVLLKGLNYPFDFDKSILESPAAPRHWPSLLALIHWLVQIASFNIHVSHSTSNTVSSLIQDNPLHQYTLSTYPHYIRGDDDAVEDLNREIMARLERQKLGPAHDSLERLRAKLKRLRRKEELEKTKGMLEDDIKKFYLLIEDLWRRMEETVKVLAGKERVLEAKKQENCRVCGENEELRRTVEAQALNTRDVERMKRELQALERAIGEAELSRAVWEDKCWELDTILTHKFRDLEALALDCNQELRRLKIGDGMQYQLNCMGPTPSEIVGFDHKLTLKPALDAFAEDIEKSYMGCLEELFSNQHKSSGNAIRLEGKRYHVAAVQSRIDQMEAQLNMMKKEKEDYTTRCSVEAKQTVEDVQVASHDLDITEREAANEAQALDGTCYIR